MAVITHSTFDPLKARCNVRLQQGVPIVDADWNELDDIRKFEMRAFLKWFVGDGIPDGCDGFRIDAAPGPVADDFIIRAGAPLAPVGAGNVDIGLRAVGRCIVDGRDVLIQSDINFKSQPLFAAAGPAGAQIAPIPAVSGAVAIYLDVSERLVTAQEDPGLVLSGLGAESCARIKREWCVRARGGLAAPKPGETDYVQSHSYCLLAILTRKLSAPNTPQAIVAADIADARHKGLTTASLETRLSRLETLLLTPAFAVGAPQFTPKSQLIGATTTLQGRNFNIGTPKVWIGNMPCALAGPATGASVAVVVPALPAGTYSVSIQTDGGGPITATDLFTSLGGALPPPPASAPTLDAVNPFMPKIQKAGQTIVINGTNFNQPNLAVSIGMTAAAIVSFSATQITIAVPAGAYTLSVNTAAGGVASAAPFTVF